jgi:hypothetical protein
MNNKEKTVKLINAILNKLYNDFNIKVIDVNGNCVKAIIKHEMDELERKLSIAMIFEVCDEIENVPFYGKILIPNTIRVVDLNTVYTFRDECKFTDEDLGSILNNPIFN